MANAVAVMVPPRQSAFHPAGASPRRTRRSKWRSTIGIAGIDRTMRFNMLATSGKAVEAAGDVNTLILDKTGKRSNRLSTRIFSHLLGDIWRTPRQRAQAEYGAASSAWLADAHAVNALHRQLVGRAVNAAAAGCDSVDLQLHHLALRIERRQQLKRRPVRLRVAKLRGDHRPLMTK